MIAEVHGSFPVRNQSMGSNAARNPVVEILKHVLASRIVLLEGWDIIKAFPGRMKESLE
jgi:hypothetical protein